MFDACDDAYDYDDMLLFCEVHCPSLSLHVLNQVLLYAIKIATLVHI